MELDTCRDNVIERYVDLDYVKCLDSKKSIMDYVFIAYDIIISWKVNL